MAGAMQLGLTGKWPDGSLGCCGGQSSPATCSVRLNFAQQVLANTGNNTWHINLGGIVAGIPFGFDGDVSFYVAGNSTNLSVYTIYGSATVMGVPPGNWSGTATLTATRPAYPDAGGNYSFCLNCGNGPVQTFTHDSGACPGGGNPYSSGSDPSRTGLSQMQPPPARVGASLPPVLRMTSRDPACNFGMFQDATLRYGPIPPDLDSLGLGSVGFLGDERFADPLMGREFRYYFEPHDGQFFLTRVYPATAEAGAYRDAILYAWAFGRGGNTREPFRLASGQPFPGSDSTCVVEIRAAEGQP